ncbi:ABC transporter ATP-binding protein [Candidatus Cryosericum hinesii]|uniref:ABC transporter ATP-binding protein n=1 Tax=Candidatus Cryosericum hinesii TaxID=2290915 RepID=A0A398DBA1_9BACT|nr:ABC transporter ATP-binding protein [Candidatus Cryosericum hinesii]RIE08456.1 ABC transporter ATP-binding protein [Candidatus Cryosericum hinesii]RIE11433.1 ABC transporter ATP-binding protein [Candidatus Cryosericum hinesii]RIE11803.1 ABC transporter ATP-binding protein [Candidatus Cryosericum hinesii]
MSIVFNEILLGIKRSIGLLSRREKRSLCIATFLMLITGILTNGPAVILGKLVDQLVSGSTILFSVVVPFILLLCIVILVREGLTVILKYLIQNIATQTDKDQTVKVIERLLKVDIGGYLYQQQIGSLYGRIFRSIEGLISLLKLTFLDFMPVFFAALAAIGIAFLQKPLMASVMILVIPTGLYLVVKQVSSQKGIRVALLRKKEEVDGKVVEMLGGIETIRVLNTVQFEVAKVEKSTEERRRIEIKHHIAMAFYDAAKSLNEGIFTIMVIVLSIYLASRGLISKGDILVYAILFTNITGPLLEIHRILDQASENSIQVNDLFNILHQPLDISFTEQDANSKIEENKSEPAVSVHNLSFAYHGSEDVTILDGINLTIKKGESIGIAGASGCGKTTFIHILLKLIHDYTGEVSLFDKGLQAISREELADKIAYVPQKPFVFSGTIKDNILYGCRQTVPDEDLLEAARNACILDEIQESLGGFNGLVSENGNNLSGGQRQRLALARVMLQTPQLIIFDEATSALDNTNEAIIQQNIERIFNQKTIITIAHRLTTLKNADRILVFDAGRIVQEGSFKSLSETKGLFQDFLQQRSKPLDLKESRNNQ